MLIDLRRENYIFAHEVKQSFERNEAYEAFSSLLAMIITLRFRLIYDLFDP